MHQRYITFTSFDSLRLFARIWSPAGQARAVVVLIHGGFEHSGRYEHVAAYLVERRLAVYAFDLRGHGKSEGRRGYVGNFEDILRDIDGFLSMAREENPGLPFFLLAHSAGGLAAVAYVISRRDHGVCGMILSAPALCIHAVPTSLAAGAIHLLGWVFPKTRLPIIDARFLSHDEQVVADYRADDLISTHGLEAGVLSELLHAMRTVCAQFHDIDIPFLVLHGTDDRLADVRGSRSLYEKARSADKAIRLYPGLYHEILNEPQKKGILKEISEWIERHIA